MASSINATTTSGVVTTADNSGILNLQSNGVTQATITSSGMSFPNSLNAINTFGFKNRLINGDMLIAQRGTSFSSLSNGTVNTSVSYGLDRWFAFRGAYTANLDMSQQTGFSGYQYCMRAQRTSGTSSTQVMTVNQIIETSNCTDMAGQSATLSVIMRAGSNYSGGAVSIAVQTSSTANDTSSSVAGGLFNTGGFSATPTITTTATTYTATGTIPATAKTIDVQISWTPSGTAGTNDYIEITGFQLEVGSQATSFDFRSIGTELFLCQRYYWQQTAAPTSYAHFAPACITGSSNADALLQWIVPMRTNPAISFTAANTFLLDGSGSFTPSSIAVNFITATNARVSLASSGMTGGQATFLGSQGSGAAQIYYSAEL
jgi:hypothetical protein